MKDGEIEQDRCCEKEIEGNIRNPTDTFRKEIGRSRNPGFVQAMHEKLKIRKDSAKSR